MKKLIIIFISTFIAVTHMYGSETLELPTTIQNLMQRLAIQENKLQNLQTILGQSNSRFSIRRWAHSHPMLTAAAGTACLCLFKRPRNLIRVGWSWLTAGATKLLGNDSIVVKTMALMGACARRAENVVKEINGESSQEAVLKDLRVRLTRAGTNINAIQTQLSPMAKNYKELEQQFREAQQQLQETFAQLQQAATALATIRAEVNQVRDGNQELIRTITGDYELMHTAIKTDIRQAQEVHRGSLDQIHELIQRVQKQIDSLGTELNQMHTQLTVRIEGIGDTAQATHQFTISHREQLTVLHSQLTELTTNIDACKQQQQELITTLGSQDKQMQEQFGTMTSILEKFQVQSIKLQAGVQALITKNNPV